MEGIHLGKKVLCYWSLDEDNEQLLVSPLLKIKQIFEAANVVSSSSRNGNKIKFLKCDTKVQKGCFN